MIVAGLTGSIAMGKTETAKMFSTRGIPVFDSDKVVHELYGLHGEGVTAIRAIVPAAISNETVNRPILSKMVQDDPALLKRIEAAVHPLVRSRQQAFLKDAERQGAPLAVLDIPLLFETGRDQDVDVVIVVSASAELQRQRALSRPGMTPDKLSFILSRQLPDEQKRAQADYVIDTSESLEATALEVEHVIASLTAGTKG